MQVLRITLPAVRAFVYTGVSAVSRGHGYPQSWLSLTAKSQGRGGGRCSHLAQPHIGIAHHCMREEEGKND